jgi:hypothetical protein
MPGLIRGVARTAAVVGTATAVSGRVSRRQQGRWADKDAPAPQAEQVPPPAPAQDTDDMYAQLAQLGELKSSGVLTETEFETEKAKILGA